MLIKIDACFKSAFNDALNHGGMADEVFVVERDVIEEVGSSDPVLEMGQDVRNELHESLFGLKVVKAKKGKVVVDGKQ